MANPSPCPIADIHVLYLSYAGALIGLCFGRLELRLELVSGFAQSGHLLAVPIFRFLPGGGGAR